MFRRFLHFITYNNAFVLIVFVLMGGAGVTLAANPEIRKEILDSHEEVRSVDNTYILSTDFSTFDPEVRIKSVTEDDEFYYVTYTFTTVEIQDYVWGPFEREEVLKVGKVQIQGRDLGLFVAEELGETVSGTLAFLKEIKKSEEANGPTLKVVTTAYSGLIGRMLNPVDKEFPGYVPVVKKAVPVVASADSSSANPTERIVREVGQALGGSSAGPVIKLNGNNPARIAKGSSYIDLGAIATDDKDEIVTVEVVSNNVNTEVVGTYQVVYRSQDSDGNLAKSVAREVRVYDSGFETIIAPPETASSTEESVPPSDTEPVPEPEVDPGPEPKPKSQTQPEPEPEVSLVTAPEPEVESEQEEEPEEEPAPTETPVGPTSTSTPVSTPTPAPASTSTPATTATSTPSVE